MSHGLSIETWALGDFRDDIDRLHQIDISHSIEKILFKHTHLSAQKDHNMNRKDEVNRGQKLTSATTGAAKATSAPRAATRTGAAAGTFMMMRLID